MTYSLPEIVRRNNPNRKAPIVMRPIYVTKAQSSELAKIYLRTIKFWREGAARLLEAYNPTPLTVDSPEETEAVLAGLTAVEATIIAAASRDIEAWIQRVVRWHNAKWAANVQAAAGVSVADLIQDQAIRDDLIAALRRNVTLVSSVSEQARERIAQAVWNGWMNRTPRVEIASEINEALRLGRARSLRVAIDQSVKLSAVLDRDRMLEAGIDEFTWIHSMKTHYRPEHKARDGKRFKWSSNVAKTDPPGYAPFCGCHARAWISLQDG